jgi:hypothetical protein
MDIGYHHPHGHQLQTGMDSGHTVIIQHNMDDNIPM